MQQNLIRITQYPILNADSTGFVREVKVVDGGVESKVTFILTADPDRAQRFGAEVHAVVEWLNKVSDSQRIDPMTEYMRVFSTIPYEQIVAKT